MENPKVAVIEYIGGHGGNELYDLGLCEAIAKTGIEVTLYTCNETSADNDLPLSIEIKKTYKDIFTGNSKLIKGWRFLWDTYQTLRDCKKQSFNIAHFHVYHFSILEFIPIWSFHASGIKTVATVHDIESLASDRNKHYKMRYTIYAQYLARVIVHSNYAKKKLASYFVHYDESKIVVIPPLDIDFIYDRKVSRATARRILGLNSSVPILLFFGHIKKVKGLDTLINALSLVKKDIKNIQLLIAGRPWKINFDYYARLINESDLASNVILRLEYIRNQSVPYYFKSADLVILPYEKIFNSSVLQRALAYSCAIIVSNLRPFLEIIKDGYNGLTFEKGNVYDLASTILKILVNKQKKRSLQKNACATARILYQADNIGRQMKKFYAQIL
jgi:glycosyltransferase involved in cell wall biosynthesis